MTSDPSAPKKDYRKTRLTGDDLSGADLSGTDFTKAKLAGVNLSGANLAGTQCEAEDIGVFLQRAMLIDGAVHFICGCIGSVK